MTDYNTTRTINLRISDIMKLETLAMKLAKLRGQKITRGQGNNTYRSELIRFAVRRLAEHPEELTTIVEDPQ